MPRLVGGERHRIKIGRLNIGGANGFHDPFGIGIVLSYLSCVCGKTYLSIALFNILMEMAMIAAQGSLKKTYLSWRWPDGETDPMRSIYIYILSYRTKARQQDEDRTTRNQTPGYQISIILLPQQ